MSDERDDVTIADLLGDQITIGGGIERIQSLTQVRRTVVIVTDSSVYQVTRGYGGYLSIQKMTELQYG